MRISILQTPIEPSPGLSSDAGPARQYHNRGLTFTELVVVLVLIALMAAMAQPRLFGLLGKSTFRAQIQEFISAMHNAVTAAGQTGQRYEVIIDLVEQSFLLRRITTPDLSKVLDEEIIIHRPFSQNCRAVYVEFDDGDWTNDGRAKFRAGRVGWQYGGKIVFMDPKQKLYSVVVDRLSRTVTLHRGDVPLLKPKAQQEVAF